MKYIKIVAFACILTIVALQTAQAQWTYVKLPNAKTVQVYTETDTRKDAELQDASKRGDANAALSHAARTLKSGTIDSNTLKSLLDILDAASSKGNALAMFQLYSLDEALDTNRAEKHLKTLAAKGDTIAMICLSQGDYTKRIAWLEKAAQKGSLTAFQRLLSHYVSGARDMDERKSFAEAYKIQKITETLGQGQVKPPDDRQYAKWVFELKEAERKRLDQLAQDYIKANKLTAFVEIPPEMRGFQNIK